MIGRPLVVLALLIAGVPSVAAVGEGTAAAVVAAGTVEPVAYYSTALNLDRRLLVYLPAAYATRPDDRFPVLYLRHGGGQSTNDWLTEGHAAQILDDLIGRGRAVPMIVVFTPSDVPVALGGVYEPPGLAAAGHELVDDVVPLIEARYRTRHGGANRALAGLSMGAGQSFAIAQMAPGAFSAVGIFSAGTFGIVRDPAVVPVSPPPGAPPLPALRPFDPDRDAAEALADPAAFNRATPLVYISVGDADPRAVPTAAAIRLMRSRGLTIVSATQTGRHEWTVWRAALADFVPRLWRTG